MKRAVAHLFSFYRIQVIASTHCIIEGAITKWDDLVAIVACIYCVLEDPLDKLGSGCPLIPI